jgi:hypothetical protein
VLDIFGDCLMLDPAFRDSIADNFRAMMAALEKRFGLEMSVEFVYDFCPDCCHVYRNLSRHAEDCPDCGAPRYEDTPNGKKARQQVRPHLFGCMSHACVSCGMSIAPSPTCAQLAAHGTVRCSCWALQSHMCSQHACACCAQPYVQLTCVRMLCIAVCAVNMRAHAVHSRMCS